MKMIKGITRHAAPPRYSSAQLVLGSLWFGLSLLRIYFYFFQGMRVSELVFGLLGLGLGLGLAYLL